MTIPLPYPVREHLRGHVDYVCPFQGHSKSRYLRHNKISLKRGGQRDYICPVGHRWHVLDDGTWFYQGNAAAGHALEDA